MWVTKRKAQEELGLTDGSMRHKIAKVWQRGKHFAIVDGRTWVNLEEVQAWITREASDQRETRSKSANLKGRDRKKRSTPGRLNLV